MLYYTGLPAIISPITDMDWDRLQLKESNDSVFKDYNIRKGRVIEGRDMFNLAGKMRAILDAMEAGDIRTMKDIQCYFAMHEAFVDFKKVMLLKGSRHWEKISDFMESEFFYQWDSFLWKYEQSGSQREHLAIMRDFLKYLNSKTDKYVLKGSAAITLCHDIDRFHESIELDGFCFGLPEIVEQFMREYGSKHRLMFFEEEMEDTTQKIVIHYGNNRNLTVHVDYIPEATMKDTEKVKDYLAYNRDKLMKDKISLFICKENIADLYEIYQLFFKYSNSGWSDCIWQKIHEMVQQCRIESVEYLLFKQQLAWLDKYDFQKKIEGFYQLFGGHKRILMPIGYW